MENVSDRIRAQHLLWTVDTNYGGLESYYMAEARGNHKQRKYRFSLCQITTCGIIHQLDWKSLFQIMWLPTIPSPVCQSLFRTTTHLGVFQEIHSTEWTQHLLGWCKAKAAQKNRVPRLTAACIVMENQNAEDLFCFNSHGWNGN